MPDAKFVVANVELVDKLRIREGWSTTDLASRMNVSEPVARALLKGEPVGSRAQWGLFNAFNGKYPFTKLFRQQPRKTEEAVV